MTPLAPSGQAVFLRLLTGPEASIIPGLIPAGRAQLAEAFGWSLEAFDQAIGEAISEGIAYASWDDRLVWLPNALKHDPPASLNAVVGWSRAFGELPDCELKERARKSIEGFLSDLGGQWLQAFTGIKPKAKPSPKPSGKPSPKPKAKASPIPDTRSQIPDTDPRSDISPPADADVGTGSKPKTDHQRVFDAYWDAFKRVRGVTPAVDGRTGSAVKKLLKLMPADEAIAVIERAFADSWFVTTRCELWQIASEPNKWRGTPPPRKSGTHRTALLQQPAPEGDGWQMGEVIGGDGAF
jgi:hypothetical protein